MPCIFNIHKVSSFLIFVCLSLYLSLSFALTLWLLTFSHILNPGSESQKGEALSLISSITDKAVPLNQYANAYGVVQNYQIGRNPLHRADQNNKGEKVREQKEVGEGGVSLEEEMEQGNVEIK